SSPVPCTIPQIVTRVSTPAESHATSQLTLVPVTAQPDPRSAYVFVTTSAFGSVRSRCVPDELPAFFTETVAKKITSLPSGGGAVEAAGEGRGLGGREFETATVGRDGRRRDRRRRRSHVRGDGRRCVPGIVRRIGCAQLQRVRAVPHRGPAEAVGRLELRRD